MNYQEKIIKQWQFKTVEEWYTAMSDSAKQFAKDIILFLKRTLKNNDIELVSKRIGHYDFSGYVKNTKTNKLVYFARSIERYGQPINLFKSDCLGGFLVREAKNEKDSSGRNNFCNLLDLENKIIELSQ